MRSTPTTACGIDVDIEPLGLRREGAVIEMVERYKRSDQDNPNRKIVEEWKQDNRIQQNSILKIEKKAARETSATRKQSTTPTV